MTDVNAINSTQAAAQAGAAPVQQQQKEQAPPPPPATETDSVQISQEARNASTSAPQPANSAEDTFDSLS